MSDEIERQQSTNVKWIGLGAGAVVIATIVIGALYWGGGDVPPDETKVIRISTFLTAIDYAPYMIARKRGWIDEALEGVGAKAEHLDPFQSPPPINEAFATDRVDVVFTAEIPTIVGCAAGIDVKIGWLSATLNSEVVVRTDSNIGSVGELRGQKIAILAGTSPHYGLVKNLEAAGIGKDEVELLDMELVAGKGKVLPGVLSPVQVVMAVREEAVLQNRAAFEALVEALERAKAWILQNPDEAQRLVSADLDLPLEVVTLAWPKIIWSAKLDADVAEDVQNKAAFLKEIGFIKRTFDVEEELMLRLEP